LRERLKLSVEQVDVFSLVGSRFQALGAATEKALSPSLRFVVLIDQINDINDDNDI